MGEFIEKVAIVTGVASGIGRASALFYAREGVYVVVSDIDKEGGQKTVRQIREKFGEVFFIKTDMANPADCEALINRTIENYGCLDFACNNAGIGGSAKPDRRLLH